MFATKRGRGRITQHFQRWSEGGGSGGGGADIDGKMLFDFDGKDMSKDMSGRERERESVRDR